MKTDKLCECFGDEGYSFQVCCEGWEKKDKIIVYSFGVGEDLSFDAKLAEKWPKCEIYAFDPTPKAIAYVDRFDKSVFGKFEFYPIGLSDRDDIVDFYLPKNPEYVSGSEIENPVVDCDNVIKVQMHTLGYIMNMLKHRNIDLLKMDIEGSEFAVIPHMMLNTWGGQQICVEVHNRFYKDGKERMTKMLNSLYSKGYQLISMSESKEEMTFLRV